MKGKVTKEYPRGEREKCQKKSEERKEGKIWKYYKINSGEKGRYQRKIKQNHEKNHV